MTGYKDIFQRKENRNWLRAVLAVQITKEGLSGFVQDVVTKLQQVILTDVINTNGLTPGTACNNCRTENVLPCKTPGICSQTRSCKFHNRVETQPRLCVARICNDIQSRIRKRHRFDRPSWANTDSTKWCSDAWEVAKCYFPPDGYNDKESAVDTDLNGVISPIINCTYFQQFMDENLNQPSNTFTVAREVGRHLRHSTTLLVTDKDLADYFSVLKKALTDPKRLQNDDGAKSAINKLSKLEVDELAITTDEIAKVIQETARQSRQLLDEVRNLNEDTHDLQNKLADLQTLKNEIKQIISKQCGVAMKAIQDETESKVSDLKTIADKLEIHARDRILYTRDAALKVIRTQQNKPADEIYEERKHELRHALAHHYWTEHDFMPLSPLMPEVDDKLTKFYMAFKMNEVDTTSSTKYIETTDSVNSYKSLFYKDNNSHRNIYIQGEAGIGKSTFCTKLGLVWSENIVTECSKNDSSIKTDCKVFSDEIIINEFDFVFSLALRNVEGECEIEEMIEKQIINELPDHTKYAGLVPKLLDKERCLIILDGLDEWSQQSDSGKRSRLVPHRKSWSKTTVLTTTRPWKLNEVCLRDSEISILIQITGITDTRTFTEKVLKCLNDKYNTTLDVKDFIRYIKDKKLKHFLDIPVVAMQLIWLWHSEHELGDSKCKIYKNMLGMLFGRAQDKPPNACDDIADNPKANVPPCFESAIFCEQHRILLDCLSSLAFHTLHSSKREESLVFSESIVAKDVKSTSALKTALKTGILSQHKSPSRSVRRSHFSFLHKTFQEFLAAYHIATHVDESENIVQTLYQVYGQTVDIMDISELFNFVCGLNNKISSKISESVMKSFSVKLTTHIEELHVSAGDYNVAGMTASLQKMILAGYKESISNGHQDPQLALHHVYYYRDISENDKIYRDRLVERNIDKIVTLCAGGTYPMGEPYIVDVVKIQQILTHSNYTLSHVMLEYVEGLKGACLDLFTNITLKSLYLCGIKAHFDIKLNTSSLLYMYLRDIDKVKHSVLSALTAAPKLHTPSLICCCLCKIEEEAALIAAPQLHTLDVRNCKDTSVLCQVLPTLPMLHTLNVSDRIIHDSQWQVLSTLSQLQRLTVKGDCEDPSLPCQALSTLSNLQYIRIVNTYLGDNDIRLPNSIQEIELWDVGLTCRSVRQLVDRLTQIPHQVTCELYKCEFELQEYAICRYEQQRILVRELDTIVKHIQQSPMFEIQKSHVYSFGGIRMLHFTKIG